MVRVYMSSGTEDEIEKGIEKWSLEFDAPVRDDGKAATVFVTRHGVCIDSNVYLTWQDICSLTGSPKTVK